MPQESDGQNKHQDGPDHPVLQQGEQQDTFVPEDLAQFFVPDFGQGRVHHQNQAGGNGDGGGTHLKGGDRPHQARQEIAGSHAQGHGEENPNRKIPVKKRELARQVF